MATSPLFGWEEPDDVDLVKDGAAAIRTLGNAIDTSMGDLLGGTTGQVLSKASNTNMDFTWVTSDDANAIQNTIVDAKGDLIAASAADTPARLAVGNNGETLVADSSTSTGLRYQSAYNGNGVINGAFDIWQRGTSIAVGAAYPYTADRWQAVRGGVVAGMTVSRQSSGLTSFQYCARIQRDSGNTSTAGLSLYNAFESNNSYQYAGQAVTFSYYARAGANYSGGALNGNLGTGTGTDQNPITASYTGSATPINTTATLTTTWQRFQGTATLSSSMTEMFINFLYVPTGTAGANDYVEITGVQVELGSIATTFKRAGGTIQGETSACQRYYQRFTGPGSNPGAAGYGYSQNANNVVLSIPPVTTMRVTPTTIDYTGLLMQDNLNNTVGTFSSVTMETSVAGPSCFSVNFTKSGAYTAGRTFRLIGASANDYIGFSAEL